MNIGAHDRHDDALRALHADALDQLSPRVRAQLQQRRRAALRGEGAGATATTSKWRLAFPLAAAAAVGALALGVQLNSLPPTTTAPVVAAVQPAASAATAGTDEPVIASTLEENPDLYVWLASDDAALMAME